MASDGSMKFKSYEKTILNSVINFKSRFDRSLAIVTGALELWYSGIVDEIEHF